MTKFSLRHISFLLCFFIGVMAMAADRKSGQVVGKIIDAEQNVPVAGALVQIIGDSSLACKSDSLGHYIIENVDVGYNILQVEAYGYEFATTESFAVSTAAPAVVDIRLRAITGKELSEITVTASPYRVGVVDDAHRDARDRPHSGCKPRHLEGVAVDAGCACREQFQSK